MLRKTTLFFWRKYGASVFTSSVANVGVVGRRSDKRKRSAEYYHVLRPDHIIPNTLVVAVR